MDTSFSEFIGQYRNHFESKLRGKLASLNTFDTPLADAMRYSALGGGKRMRPLLAYATASIIGDINATTDDFACALECMHVYSLIHDDLPAMDDDALRRGKPTCHIAFGEATAILAGDALQNLAIDIVANAPAIAPQTTLSAIRELTQAAGASGMILGQAIDLASVEKDLNIDELERMHTHKTGALIEASVILGAISTHASPVQLGALRKYARTLGLAFQVQDDILDVTSDTQTLGKKQGADQRLNKPTYVSLLGLEQAQKKANELKNSAIDSLEIFGDRAAILIELAKYTVNRAY